MSKKSRPSHAQKRKQKLAKRESRKPQNESHAFTGNPYRSKAFVKPLYKTEIGIYEGFVISDRKLTDADVQRELQILIERLRSEPMAELLYPPGTRVKSAEFDGWATTGILHRWGEMFELQTLPDGDDLIGILQTILGSLETWRSRSASSRGYLSYLEGFLTKLGVSVKVIVPDGTSIPEEQLDELYEVGELWLAGSPEACRRFTLLANELLEKGNPDRVVNACQKLLGRIGSPTRPEFAILSELSIRAQNTPAKNSRTEMGSGLMRFIARLSRG